MSDERRAVYGIRPHRPMTEAEAAQAKRLAELPVPQEQIDQIVQELGDKPKAARPMAIAVSIEEQQHQDDMRARSVQLAYERGHLRRN
ncbi:hypothetical protein [Nocardia sp. NPDC059228]|uniref:hypothetical protein n=1 Tax=Nocardia sp. NPDC059228 TaxID=3346777 RepID=UPI0036A8FA95